MKFDLRFRHIAFACAMTAFSAAAIANADSSTTTAGSGGFWSFFKHSKKQKAADPDLSGAVTPAATPTPPTQYSAFQTYEVSLDANHTCNSISEGMRASLEASAQSQQAALVESSLDASKGITCEEQKETYEGVDYPTAHIYLSFSYTNSAYGQAYAPTVNADYVGGAAMSDQQANGSWGLYPDYASCQAAAATILPMFDAQTGAKSFGYYCQPSTFNYQTVAYHQQIASIGTARPMENFSLKIYSAGARAKKIFVSSGELMTTDEFGGSVSLIKSTGAGVAYPLSASDTSRFVAYFAKDNAITIQLIMAGDSTDASECSGQTAQAESLFAKLGAISPKYVKAFCESRYAGKSSLDVLVVGSPYIMMNDLGDTDLTFPTYAECVSQEPTLEKARGNPYLSGVLCFPDSKDPANPYQAHFYEQ